MLQNIIVDYGLPIGTLIVLEVILSGDNALVLAILVKHLPDAERKKALYYGLLGAFIFRFIAILLALYLAQLWYLRGIGAFYLGYLSIKHFIRYRRSTPQKELEKQSGFWNTVVTVELTDMAFALDSILVAVALSQNMWVVYTGVMLGIIALRIATGGVLKLLDKFPALEDVAYVLIGWIAVKLFIETGDRYAVVVLHKPFYQLPAWLFWTVIGLIMIIGTIYASKENEEMEI
jgi:YkoY family integral membrane protein